jgi:hypothetical protein
MARDGERGRGDWKARRGSRNSGPYADSTGDPESGGTGPVDIAAVRRDDALIDAIAGDGRVATDSPEEYQLAALLADWRAEIIEPPLPAGPDLDAIVAAVNQEIGARQTRVGGRRGNLRLVRPLLGAAAAVAVIAGGTTAFSYSAQPGDPLWRVKEVVFSEQAQTTIAQHADEDLTKAQDFLAQNHPEQARALLQSASSTATQVNDDGRKSDLLEKYNQLLAQLQVKAPEVAAGLTPVIPPRQSPPGSSVPTSAGEQPVTPGGSGRPTYDPRYAPQSPGGGSENPGGGHGSDRTETPGGGINPGGPIVPPEHGTTVVSPPSEPSAPGGHETGGHETGGSHDSGGGHEPGGNPDGGTPAGPSTIATPGESAPPADKPGTGDVGGGAPGSTPAPNSPVKPVAPSGDDPHLHPTIAPVAPTTVLLPPIGGGLGGIK